jgi:hypothetical protein
MFLSFKVLQSSSQSHSVVSRDLRGKLLKASHVTQIAAVLSECRADRRDFDF